MAKRKPPVEASRLEQLIIVGNHPVDGHEPGALLTRHIGAREEMLIASGHLARATDIADRASLELERLAEEHIDELGIEHETDDELAAEPDPDLEL